MGDLLATVTQGAGADRGVDNPHDLRSRTRPRWQLHKVADGVRTRFASAAALLEDVAQDVLAYGLFPIEHQRQRHSTNVLVRLNKELKGRSNVVGIFPAAKSTLRLVRAVLLGAGR